MADRDAMAERFAADTAKHQMTVLHDDGLYRHVRFKAPDSGFYWFDLTTWPGYLAFTGDMDGYVFARMPDMFEFFRGSGTYGINAVYWSEKLATGRGRDGAKAYSVERFRQLVIERFVENVRDGGAPRGLGKAVREEILDDPDIYHEAGARDVLESFRFAALTGEIYNGPGGPTPLRGPEFRFTDTYEWELRDWDWTFLWACHAIQWGIGRYDASRKADRAVARG